MNFDVINSIAMSVKAQLFEASIDRRQQHIGPSPLSLRTIRDVADDLIDYYKKLVKNSPEKSEDYQEDLIVQILEIMEGIVTSTITTGQGYEFKIPGKTSLRISANEFRSFAQIIQETIETDRYPELDNLYASLLENPDDTDKSLDLYEQLMELSKFPNYDILTVPVRKTPERKASASEESSRTVNRPLIGVEKRAGDRLYGDLVNKTTANPKYTEYGTPFFQIDKNEPLVYPDISTGFYPNIDVEASREVFAHFIKNSPDSGSGSYREHWPSTLDAIYSMFKGQNDSVGLNLISSFYDPGKKESVKSIPDSKLHALYDYLRLSSAFDGMRNPDKLKLNSEIFTKAYKLYWPGMTDLSWLRGVKSAEGRNGCLRPKGYDYGICPEGVENPFPRGASKIPSSKPQDPLTLLNERRKYLFQSIYNVIDKASTNTLVTQSSQFENSIFSDDLIQEVNKLPRILEEEIHDPALNILKQLDKLERHYVKLEARLTQKTQTSDTDIDIDKFKVFDF